MKTTDKLDFDATKGCCDDPAAGDLFPDLLHLETNRMNRGRLFAAKIDSCGIGIQGRELVVDADAWRSCAQHPSFEQSFKVSMAKVAMQQVLIKL